MNDKAPLTPSPAPPDPAQSNGFRSWHDVPGPLTKLNFFIAQYRPFVYLAFGALLWMGIQVTGPGSRIGAAEVRITDVERMLSRLVNITEANARLNCFNPQYTQQQRELVGLDCAAVLRGDYVRQVR
ncbi:MAG: hypothetical protein WEA80_01915 [Gemmatimonadaceae bacterium]